MEPWVGGCLPSDVWLKVGSYLDPISEFGALLRTSKHLNKVVRNHLMPNIVGLGGWDLAKHGAHRLHSLSECLLSLDVCRLRTLLIVPHFDDSQPHPLLHLLLTRWPQIPVGPDKPPLNPLTRLVYYGADYDGQGNKRVDEDLALLRTHHPDDLCTDVWHFGQRNPNASAVHSPACRCHHPWTIDKINNGILAEGAPSYHRLVTESREGLRISSGPLSPAEFADVEGKATALVAWDPDIECAVTVRRFFRLPDTGPRRMAIYGHIRKDHAQADSEYRQKMRFKLRREKLKIFAPNLEAAERDPVANPYFRFQRGHLVLDVHGFRRSWITDRLEGARVQEPSRAASAWAMGALPAFEEWDLGSFFLPNQPLFVYADRDKPDCSAAKLFLMYYGALPK